MQRMKIFFYFHRNSCEWGMGWCLFNDKVSQDATSRLPQISNKRRRLAPIWQKNKLRWKKHIRFSSCRINFWFAKLLKRSWCAQVLIKQVQMLLSFHQPSGRLRWNFSRSLKYHCQKQLWQVKRKLTSSSISVSPYLQTWWGNVILIAQPFKRWFKLCRE